MIVFDKEFKIAMYKVLLKISENNNFKELEVEYDLNYLCEVLNQAYSLEYVTGVHPIGRSANGHMLIDTSNPKLTDEGNKFIKNFEI